MNNLSDLSITHRKNTDVSGLKATFERAHTLLPSVKRLKIQTRGNWAFLIDACPNVEVLVLAHNLQDVDMIRAANALTHLYRLELCSYTWSLRSIEHIATTFTALQILALKGEIDHELVSVSVNVAISVTCVKY